MAERTTLARFEQQEGTAVASEVCSTFDLQQALMRPLSQQPSRRAAAITKAGGFTPWRFAQASFSRFVWQQQLRQQLSASLQPHAQC
jgi:hypothetical protein